MFLDNQVVELIQEDSVRLTTTFNQVLSLMQKNDLGVAENLLTMNGFSVISPIGNRPYEINGLVKEISSVDSSYYFIGKPSKDGNSYLNKQNKTKIVPKSYYINDDGEYVNGKPENEYVLEVVNVDCNFCKDKEEMREHFIKAMTESLTAQKLNKNELAKIKEIFKMAEELLPLFSMY